MTDPNKTEIAFITDRSGSMSSIKADMKGGFATFMQEQRALPGELVCSHYQFDSAFDVVFEEKPAAQVGELQLDPRGGTALLEAVCRSVELIGERLAKKPEHERPGAVIIMVITDGHENASGPTYTAKRVKDLIEQQERDYKWKFMFLGADLKGLEEAATAGFTRNAHYEANAEGVGGMYAHTSNTVRSYRSAVAGGDKDADMKWDPKGGVK